MKISSTEIQSRKNPVMKQISRKTKSVTQGERSASEMSRSVRATPPEAMNTPANMLPPRMINMIMQVILRVLSRASVRTARENFRYIIDMRIEPKAPSAAASVGAASPIMIEPRTAKIMSTGGTSATSVMRIFTAKGGSSGERGRRGPALGSSVQRTRM